MARRRQVSWKTILAVMAVSYAVSSALRTGSWGWVAAVLLLTLLVVGTRVVAGHRSIRGIAGMSQALRESRAVQPLTDALARANDLATSGDLSGAMRIADEIGAHPVTARVPLLAASLAMLRCDLAQTQGDFETAEREALACVRFHRQGTNRSALSESLEKLGKVQLLLGRNEDAERTLVESLEAGGSQMYPISRVRTELYLANIAHDRSDLERARAHALAARKSAAKRRCHPQHVAACDLLALMAIEDERPDEALRWMRESEGVVHHKVHALPHRVRHLIATALVARSQGRDREALAAYLEMMRGVATLRTGWRDAQSYYVDLYSESELSAFTTAHALYLKGEDGAVDAFGRLLDLGNRTALRRMLRGGLAVEAPAELDDPDMAGILGLLSAIAEREGTQTANPAVPGWLLAESAQDAADAGRPESAQAYERLETLVSARFRQAMGGGPDGPDDAADAREYAVARGVHVLQTRLLDDGEQACVAGLWTAPDGSRHPFLHPVDTERKRLLGEVTGTIAARHEEDATPPEAAPGEVRAQAPNWRTTPRYRHLVDRNSEAWAVLTGLLLPPELITLLRDTDPEGDVPGLLLVPDASLWRVPWAALRVAPTGHEGHLLDRAILAMLPSLSLLTGTRPTAPPPGDGAAGRAFSYLAGVHPGGLAVERDALDAAYGADVTHATGPAGLLTALDPGEAPYAVGAASVHGNSRPGLAHALLLDRGTTLSAARMLTLRFPRTLVVSACFSAELDGRRGTDPLGIPTVALCRGADTVIGGIFPLPDGELPGNRPDHATAKVVAILYGLLAEGVPPSTALRRAQRQWRRDTGHPPPWLWAGLVSITTHLAPADRRSPRAA
ncbi:CHAT domain-containing protein [Streptomyces sp. NPDC047023]|uniref:CHAT domain-containing protein n=1 Tax=Streptomyces sp. NPDC047023 TaxID=3155139 RepID=UPI0033F1918B